MRISDWSSDVCSSDLAWVFGGARRGIVSAIERRSEIAPGEARAARRQRQRTEPMLGEESEPDHDDDAEAAAVRRPPVPPLQRLARAQIGSASGRARVCPYG